MKTLYILVLSCCCLLTNGQSIAVIKEKLAAPAEDTVRVNLLIKLATALSTTNKDSSRICIDNAIALAVKLNFTDGLMRSNVAKAEIFEKPNRKESIDHYLAALPYARTLNRKDYEMRILNRVGGQFYMLGDYVTAEDYYVQTLDLARTIKDFNHVVTSSTNLGMTYTKLTDYSRAFEALTLSNRVADSLGMRANIGGNCIDIAHLLTLQKKYDEAILYYDKAIEIFLQENEPEIAGFATVGKGETYMQKGDYARAVKLFTDLRLPANETTHLQYSIYQNLGASLLAMRRWSEAEAYLLKAKSHNEQVTKSPVYAVQNYLGLARLYLQTQKIPQGLEAAHNAEVLAKQQNSLQQTKECYQVLSSLYESAGKLDKSLAYQKWYTSLQDSIAQIDQSTRLAEAETKFRLGEKNREVALLAKENELQKTREQFSRITMIVLVVVLLFVFFASLALARAYRRSHAKNNLLALQKTEIENANQLITNQANKLMMADKMKSRFFANISHELRTPVTLISGMLEFMAESKTSSKEKDRVEIALGNSRKLSAIVEEMLDLTRAEAGRIILKKKTHHLQPLLSRTANMFGSLLERNQIRLIMDLSSSPIYVDVDESYFEKIINNLVYNAIKFTSTGGWIRINIRLSDDKEEVEIHISDSGSGIAEEDLPYIFDRFYQTTSGAQAKDLKGTGIGLSLVKEFTELHGGGVTVSSKLHHGSVFTVRLPVSTMHDGTVSAPEASPEFEWMQFKKPPVILLVEDHEEMRSYIIDVLGGQFKIVQAAHGAEALQWLASNEADLIISDVMMPVMDGYTFLSSLKADEKMKHIPVIMLTARASEEDKLHGLRLGVDDYVVKPFQTTELRVRVQNLLKNQIQRKEWILKPITLEEQMPEVDPGKKQFLDTVTVYVESRISDALIGVGDLAAHLAVSERQLYRTSGELTGLAPAQLIKEIRLKKAYQLLLDRKVAKVAELASMVGYDSAAYFSKQFMERFGKRPTEFL